MSIFMLTKRIEGEFDTQLGEKPGTSQKSGGHESQVPLRIATACDQILVTQMCLICVFK